MAKNKPHWKYLQRISWTLLALLLGPIAVLAFGNLDLATHWSRASLASTGKSPLPYEHKPALVQIYGARAYNWRGAFGIHTWIATKRRNADHYQVYQVIGWNLYRGHSTVSVRKGGPPDFLWFNAEPELLLEYRGADTETVIDKIEQAVSDYPYPYAYHAWPGPNSNTFTAFIARRVPELGLDLVNSEAAYIVIKHKPGVVLNIFDGEKMLFDPSALPVVTPDSNNHGNGSERFAPQFAPVLGGGTFMCWTGADKRIKLRYVDPTGALGEIHDITGGKQCAMAEDPVGDIHMVYVEGSLKYRQLTTGFDCE